MKPEENLFVPNVFSPNSDGENDMVNVFGNGLEDIHFMIFNRWGEMIYNEENDKWDGNDIY